MITKILTAVWTAVLVYTSVPSPVISPARHLTCETVGTTLWFSTSGRMPQPLQDLARPTTPITLRARGTTILIRGYKTTPMVNPLPPHDARPILNMGATNETWVAGRNWFAHGQPRWVICTQRLDLCSVSRLAGRCQRGTVSLNTNCASRHSSRVNPSWFGLLITAIADRSIQMDHPLRGRWWISLHRFGQHWGPISLGTRVRM